jgi:hypothetical protein
MEVVIVAYKPGSRAGFAASVAGFDAAGVAGVWAYANTENRPHAATDRMERTLILKAYTESVPPCDSMQFS